MSSPISDLLRLVAVPFFALAAYRDIRTRRVRNVLWLPLVSVGAVLFVADASVAAADPFRTRQFAVHAAVSLGIVAPLGYLFWRVGGFGGADAKAIMVLALLFPEFPVYYLPGDTLPLVVPPLGVLSMTVLSNTVLVGLAFPFVLAARNVLAGHVALPMFVGRPARVPDVATDYGSLLETPDGFTRRGLDLDALRMYLRWRGLTLSDLRRDPDRYRDPASLPPEGERGDPTDGALAAGPAVADGGEALTPAVRRVADVDDPWGAAAFLASLDGSAYGTTPDGLRAGLEVLVAEDEVWLTPGLPFIVPMFVGLVLAVTYGDLLFSVLTLVVGV
ncbi:A24 family peptidase [Halosegnis marinus]|uniref:Prepilin peptidase n=1 Tax=Halosegnis marinus TaxID=3034023 RepID=A0ABD5ZPI2_9EURY|nr:A24 family peptidase [Halosegnis sp. DT85]